jgi:uroporphyrin-III C-methyltransferase
MALGTPRGTVYLVGAGPGDPELMTLKAARLLSEAEAVVHDALVDPSILERIAPEAERWYAGKRGGDHYLTQDEINELLLELAGRLDVVVRLKGGDPYLFGRGAEEQEFLVHRGVRVEVVPGVTSALAVPACAGIPLTHRDLASMAVIVTGHQRVDGRFESVDWCQLGALPATLSILMGVKNIEEVVSGLIRGGRSPETCTAVIQWGTTTRQRVVEATLGTIVEQITIHRVGPPAVLVVGDVVGLRRKLTCS